MVNKIRMMITAEKPVPTLLTNTTAKSRVSGAKSPTGRSGTTCGISTGTSAMTGTGDETATAGGGSESEPQPTVQTCLGIGGGSQSTVHTCLGVESQPPGTDDEQPALTVATIVTPPVHCAGEAAADTVRHSVSSPHGPHAGH